MTNVAEPTTVKMCFLAEKEAYDLYRDNVKSTDTALAPVIIAAKMIWSWMTVDNPKRRGWVPRGHYPQPAPKPKIDRYLSDDKQGVYFYITRTFAGSERHGSDDLQYVASFTVSLDMIERADIVELEKFLREKAKCSNG